MFRDAYWEGLGRFNAGKSGMRVTVV